MITITAFLVIAAVQVRHPAAPYVAPDEVQPSPTSIMSEALVKRDELVVSPSACTPTAVACDGQVRGELGIGDCTASNGTYLDALYFQGTAGDYVDVILWPLDPSYTNPVLLLLPPPADGSKTPTVFGGTGGQWMSYVLSTSGTWGIGVATTDLFGKGRYGVRLYCSANPDPTSPQSCVGQNLTCGQAVGWTLTAQSCAFENTKRPYADHWIYGIAGDFLTASVSSSDFSPLVVIYSDRGGAALAVGSAPSGGRSSVSWSVPVTGWYSVVATPSSGSPGGFYVADVSCATSGCVPPIIVDMPVVPKSIHSGDRITLSARAQSAGGLKYTWFDVDGLSQTPLSNSATFTTQPITSKRTVRLLVETPCGEDSTSFILAPSVTKRRAIKR
ncbi:MAG TPA: hypothetical protein VLV78_11330 [Thermoanaerobaculia bacterium]|nr:hypothetical protein [Thermoanaerobaculia bacterium]